MGIEDYDNAIIYKPDYTAAYSNRAFIYLNMGNTKSGCNDARKACGFGNCRLLKLAEDKGVCP